MFGKKKAAAVPASKPPASPPLNPPDLYPPEMQFQRPPAAETTAQPAPSFGTVAPVSTQHEGSPSLFVKIERYTDIQEHLQELKYSTTNMRNILDRLSESQKKLQVSLSLSYSTLEKMNQTLDFLGAKFSGRVMRTPEAPFGGGMERPPAPPRAEATLDEDLQGYLRGINNQVEKIRNDLKTSR